MYRGDRHALASVAAPLAGLQLPALDVRPGGLRELLDLGEERFHPTAHAVGDGIVAERWEVDEDVLRGAVRGGLGQAGGDGEVARGVQVAPAGERLGRHDDGAASLHGPQGHVRGHACRRADSRGPGDLLHVRLAGKLEGTSECRVGSRILVGEREETRGEVPAGGPVTGVAGAVRGVLGTVHRE
jgi:hypothetical protein